MLGPHPPGVVVVRCDSRPPVALLLDAQLVPAKRLRHLLGVVAGLGPHGSNLHAAPHRACFSIFSSSIAFTRGQSSSTIAYQAESRIESGSFMCLRKIPSNVPPTPSSAPRTRRLRASVLNSTRIAPQRSNACERSRYFVS